MDLRALNIVVLVAAGGLFLASGTQREHSVLAEGNTEAVRTLDLVVLAAEWGHGRRQGWLSNLHLGARGADGYVMVGKTFKGMTDALLVWQTEQFLARKVEERGITVHVRPELVVEIAVDGVQKSTRYPGGVALRFARVKRYRPDKLPSDADAIEMVQSFLPTAR